MILGLTGGYCSGKSSAAAVLRNAGWTVVDVDALGHAALELSAAAVAALLGPDILDATGRPVRRAIGRAVFADPALLAQYEAIVHPVMNDLVLEAVQAAGDRTCIDAALLYRLPAAGLCDAIIEVRAPLVARLLRGMARDGLGLRAILSRIARQQPLRSAGQTYKAITIIVRNTGNKKQFSLKIHAAADRARLLTRA